MIPSITKLDLEQYPESLPGEDRSFGGKDFSIEIVPPGAWFKNLRSMMSPLQWNLISRYVRDRAGNRCEICDSDRRMEAHERWVFNEETKTQKLVRLISLCKNCHLGTHWGLAGQLGFAEEIKKHIFAVTGWTEAEFQAHRSARSGAAFSEDWKIDVSMVEAAGITIFDPTPQIAAKHQALANQQLKTLIDYDGSGGRLDLSRELRSGLVAFISRSDKDVHGCIPLSDCGHYLAKEPSKLGKRHVKIPLTMYIKAHNNPIKIKREKDLEAALEDLNIPRRLIIKSNWVYEGMHAEYLKHGIIFSI
jgi:hypothetical protein